MRLEQRHQPICVQDPTCYGNQILNWNLCSMASQCTGCNVGIKYLDIFRRQGPVISLVLIIRV